MIKKTFTFPDLDDGIFGGSGWADRLFGTNAAAAVRNHAPDFVHVLSYSSLGDAGGATYALETAQPAHELKLNIGSQWFGFRNRTVTPEVCGADPAGDTSSDPAFERLVDYINQVSESSVTGRGLLINATGRYKLNDEHILSRSDLTFDFQGRGILDLSASSAGADADAWAVLHFTLADADRFGPRTTMTVDAPAGVFEHSTFTVADASVLAVGDAIAITSTGEYWNGIPGVGGYASSNKGELNFVQFITGNVITPAIPLKDSYAASTYTTYVRRVNLLDDITIRGMRAIGPGGGALHTTANPTGVRAIDWEFCRRATITDSFLENFPRFAMLSYLGFDQSMVNTKVIGRKLDDPTNYIPSHVSQWFTGWVTGGVQGVNVIGSDARFARRLVDPDASPIHMFDDDLLQTIPSRDIHIVGGNSYACITGPAGHKYQGLNVVGHTVVHCGTGIQHRGKDLYASNCNVTCEVGLVVGVGTIDPATYTEPASSGLIRIDQCDFECSQIGVNGVVAWDDFRLTNSRFRARKVVELNGKSYPNWRADNNEFIGTEPTNPIIRDNYLPKTSLTNWHFTNNLLQGGTYGLDILGSSVSASQDLIFDGNVFLDCSLRAIRFGSTGVPLWGPRIIVRDSISDMTISGLSDGFGANALEIGNDWPQIARTLTIASDAVTIPDNYPLGYPMYFHLDTEGGAATDNLATINGGVTGHLVVFTTSSGTRDITVKNGTGNIFCGADFLMDVPQDVVALMKITAGTWAAIHTMSNA